MKKAYEAPVLELDEFEPIDVLTSSSIGDGYGEVEDPFDE